MRWSIEHGMVVRRAGEGARPGPRVVWIHGLGESSVSFEPVIAKLPGYEHVLVDLPGYGRSQWPERAPSLAELADQLARWLADEQPATIVGHSMGGVLCTLVAERCAVRAVVNIEGNLTRGDCTFSALASAYELSDFCAHGFSEIRARVYAEGLTKLPLRTYHAAMCLASPHVFHRHALELVQLSSGGTLGPRLAALRVPRLYVAGVPDGICAESRALLDRLGVRWVGLEPAGHWVYLDQLDRFAAEAARFFAEL
jgi:pimeloyl-ACP methyl ester carboxylesterase